MKALIPETALKRRAVAKLIRELVQQRRFPLPPKVNNPGM